LPRYRSRDVIHLLPAAAGIFLVSFADEILTVRSFAGEHSRHARASQELPSLGSSEIVSETKLQAHD